jgi:hypothetical protein
MCSCKCSVKCAWPSEIGFDDFVGEIAMCVWSAGQRPHPESAVAFEGTHHRAALLAG